MAEAEVFLAKGISTAETYKFGSGCDVVGKEGGRAMVTNFFGIRLLEKLTGKYFGKERKMIVEKTGSQS